MSYISIVVLIIAIVIVFLPNSFWHILMFVDFFTPWVLPQSTLAKKYHQYLISGLPELPEMPLQEIPFSEASEEKIWELTKGYTFPLVVRGGTANVSAIGTWENEDFWLDNYGDDEVLCGILGIKGREPRPCLLKEALTDPIPWYINGETKLFANHPELKEMVHTDHWEKWIRGEKVYTQIFMGYKGMGSDVHNAMGLNVFRQITGRKKWWLMDPSQTAYLFGAQNPTGFSAMTTTFVGVSGMKPSPWLNKIKRYTVTLEPGDVLLNTPWCWHAIINPGNEGLENDSELVIGVPTRWKVNPTINAKVNWVQTIMGVYTFFKDQIGPKHELTVEQFQDHLTESRFEQNKLFHQEKADA